jgi:hypothetical protein
MYLASFGDTKDNTLNQSQKYVLHLFVDKATHLINKIVIH